MTGEDITLQDIIAQERFVLHKYSAIPTGLDFGGGTTRSRGVSFSPSSHSDGVLFAGNVSSFSSQSGSLSLAQSLYDYYQ